MQVRRPCLPRKTMRRAPCQKSRRCSGNTRPLRATWPPTRTEWSRSPPSRRSSSKSGAANISDFISIGSWMFLVASFMHKRTKQVGQLYSSVCDNSFLSRGFVVSIVPAPRCEVKHAASFAASSRWLSSPRQGSFILSNEAAKYAQVSFWKLTDGLCCCPKLLVCNNLFQQIIFHSWSIIRFVLIWILRCTARGANNFNFSSFFFFFQHSHYFHNFL